MDVTPTSFNSNRATMVDMIRDCSPNRIHLSKTSDKHASAVLEQLNALRKRNELCDIILCVGNRKIPAHRVVLSGEMSESRQIEVLIHDVDENAMECIIDFCYSSQITVDEKNVQTVLPAACILQMQEVQDCCCEFLKGQLDPSNCLGIRAFADTHACNELLRFADKYTQRNFNEVKENEEFLQLSAQQLIDIISSDELNVTSEEDVFRAVMQWVRYKLDERQSCLYQVLQHIRLPLTNPKFIVGTVGSDPLIRMHQNCRDLVDEAKDYLLLPQDRPNMQGPRTTPRNPSRSGEILFAVGGWCTGDAISSVEAYDPQINEWKMVSGMTKCRCGVGVGVLNNLLYAVGGHDGLSYLNTVERYDPHTNSWCLDIAPTSSCRTSMGVAVLDGALYAVGGQDGVSCLSMVERYDPVINRWTKVANMNTRRLGVAVAVADGCLYAIGGSDGSNPLNTVERYDPRINRWFHIAVMNTRRKHLGSALYNGCIYAVGGRDDVTELSSAERFNPKTNVWTPVVAMNSRRSGVGLAVVSGQLMAVGGFDGAGYLKSVEVYDPEQNQWKLLTSMNHRRLGGGRCSYRIGITLETEDGSGFNVVQVVAFVGLFLETVHEHLQSVSQRTRSQLSHFTIRDVMLWAAIGNRVLVMKCVDAFKPCSFLQRFARIHESFVHVLKHLRSKLETAVVVTGCNVINSEIITMCSQTRAMDFT